MNERGIIFDALVECKESLDYMEKRLTEIESSDRKTRQSIKNGIVRSSVRVETIIELAHALEIISEEESLMEPGTLIESLGIDI